MGRGLSVPNLDFLSRYSTFLPQPKGMHDILVISDCKLTVAVNVSVTGLCTLCTLPVSLIQLGRLQPSCDVQAKENGWL